MSNELASLETKIGCRGVEFGVGGFVDGGNNEAVHDTGHRENESCNSADSEQIHRLQS